MTNVFPESMNNKEYRLQQDGFLREQSVPLSLPAHNRYMHAVDVTVQSRKTKYGFDRKSGVPGLDYFTLVRISPFNAHILYKHNCKKSLPKDQHAFCLELAHLLLQKGTRAKTARLCKGEER